MPSSVSPDPAVIIARLRAAGCVFAEEEASLLIAAAPAPTDLAALVARRESGLPLEHVLGWARFGGLRIAVDAGVFVPRRRTEFLVRTAAALARERDRSGPPPVVLDLCCGSGALGVALVTRLGAAELHASDVDPAAAACARRNVAAVGGRVYQGDLFEPLPAALRGRVDLLLANVPYVPTGEVSLLPAEARVHEQRVALDGGADGLDVVRRVAAQARGWLSPGGAVLVETGDRQVPAALAAFARGGLLARVATAADLAATLIVGARPA